LRRAEGGAKILGYFVWKITILRKKKIIFFPILGGGRVPGAYPPPWIRPWVMMFNATFNNISAILSTIFQLYYAWRYNWNIVESDVCWMYNTTSKDKIKSQIINGFLFCLQTSRWHILNIVVPLLWILTIIENCMLSVFRLWKVSCIDYFIQIYHVWEGYLRKIPVERRTISRDEWRMKFSLKTGIFHKYSSQTWYMFNYTEYYFRTLAK
jgi:hypothetical protein